MALGMTCGNPRGSWKALLASLILASLWTGCQSGGPGPVNPKNRFVFPGEGTTNIAGTIPEVQPAEGADPLASVGKTAPAVSQPAVSQPAVTPHPTSPEIVPTPLDPARSGRFLRIGDKITVTFADIPTQIPPHETTVRDDGSVSLPYNKFVKAAGRSTGELEDFIRKEYVPSIFVHCTVSVKPEFRFFFVGGEVKAPNRQQYWDEMTVLRAIQSAGDFTDFANRKKIELIRANGQRHVINWNKAVKNPKLDLEVFPGDTIIVHRRLW